MAVQGVLRVNLHASGGQSSTHIVHFRYFDILASERLGVDRIDLAIKVQARRPVLGGTTDFEGCLVVALEPAPGEATKGSLYLVVSRHDSLLLCHFNIQRWIVVEVYPEDVAGGVVGCADSVKNDIAPIFLPVPVHHIVLAISG